MKMAQDGGEIVGLKQRPLYLQEILLVLISVRGWVDPSSLVRPERLWQWKIPMTPSGMEPATFWSVEWVSHKRKIQSRRIVAWRLGMAAEEYLLTYSMVQNPSWEANWFAASQEIPRISRNPTVHYRTHKRPPPVSILGQPSPVHIPTSHLLEIHPNINHPSTPRSPQWSPSLRFLQQDPIQPSLLTNTRHMPSKSATEECLRLYTLLVTHCKHVPAREYLFEYQEEKYLTETNK